MLKECRISCGISLPSPFPYRLCVYVCVRPRVHGQTSYIGILASSSDPTDGLFQFVNFAAEAENVACVCPYCGPSVV